MLVDEEQLERLLRKLANIREEIKSYTIPGDEPSPSVEDLQFAIQNMYSLQIVKYEVLFTAVYLQSMVRRYADGRAIILIRSGQSLTHQRCATVKELCHLALDEREDWSPNGTATIKGLIETFKLELYHNGNHEPQNRVMLQEHLALFAAAELLYPEQYRDADYAELCAKRTSLQRLALDRLVTPRIVNIALNPTNRAACVAVRQRIHNENNA